MPSIRDKAPDGVLCTFSNSSWICQKLAAEQLQTRASGTVRQGRRHGPSITTPGCVSLLQSARRASVLIHLSSLRRHWSTPSIRVGPSTSSPAKLAIYSYLYSPTSPLSLLSGCNHAGHNKKVFIISILQQTLHTD